MKRLFCLLLLTACSTYTRHYSSESLNWCFIDFQHPATFLNYIENHKEYAENGNPNSMKLLGCAYYQKGDWLLAERWLHESFNKGELDASTALTAVYLKEGDLPQAAAWVQHIPLETDLVRWLKILIALERYQESEEINDLIQAQHALKNKINYEGETTMTLSLLESISQLIQEAEQCTFSNCSVVNFQERKTHLSIISTGALSTLIPSTPLKWNMNPDETADAPSIKNQEAVLGPSA